MFYLPGYNTAYPLLQPEFLGETVRVFLRLLADA